MGALLLVRGMSMHSMDGNCFSNEYRKLILATIEPPL